MFLPFAVLSRNTVGNPGTKRKGVTGYKIDKIFSDRSGRNLVFVSGLISFFTSTDEKRPTYIFHPYSYTISRGYNNPKSDALVPTLMVTKRHLFKEFVPSQLRVKLLNNTGVQFKNVRSTTSADPS